MVFIFLELKLQDEYLMHQCVDMNPPQRGKIVFFHRNTEAIMWLNVLAYPKEENVVE